MKTLHQRVRNLSRKLFGDETVLTFMLSAAFLGLAFYTSLLWWLGLILLVPLFVYIFEKATSLKDATKKSYLFGLVFTAVTNSYILDSLPFTWLEEVVKGADLLIVAGYFALTSLVLALSFIPFGIILYLSKRFSTSIQISIAIITYVPIVEVGRALLFAVLYYGESSIFGLHYSFGHLGYLLAEHGLFLQLATYGNVYVLGVVVVAFNALFYVLRQKCTSYSTYRNTIIGVFALVFVSQIIWTHIVHPQLQAQPSRSIDIAIMTTDFRSVSLQKSDSEREKRKAVLEQLVDRYEQTVTDNRLLLVPEATNCLLYTSPSPRDV